MLKGIPADQEPFIRHFLKHEGSLRALLRALLVTWDEVDDVAQETCIVAMRKFHQFEEGTNFCAWLLAIGRYEALRYQRNRSTRRLELATDVIEQLEAEAADFDRDLSGRREALDKCVRALPDSARALLQAVYSSQTPIQEIALQADKSPDAVYKKLQRLRHRLLDCINRSLIGGAS